MRPLTANDCPDSPLDGSTPTDAASASNPSTPQSEVITPTSTAATSASSASPGHHPARLRPRRDEHPHPQRLVHQPRPTRNPGPAPSPSHPTNGSHSANTAATGPNAAHRRPPPADTPRNDAGDRHHGRLVRTLHARKTHENADEPRSSAYSLTLRRLRHSPGSNARTRTAQNPSSSRRNPLAASFVNANRAGSSNTPGGRGGT